MLAKRRNLVDHPNRRSAIEVRSFLPMWLSFAEYVPAVLRHWWFSATGLASGILFLISLFATIPAIPRWFWVVLFIVFVSAAQFQAFHQLREQRDKWGRPGLSLLGAPCGSWARWPGMR